MSDALSQLLRSLQPVRHPGVYAFVSAPTDAALDALEPLATFREAEGLTLIVDEARARRARLPVLFRAAWITLEVASDLHAVGLTAAISSELARAGIACNLVAAAHHDHLFVPEASADLALATLQALQRRHRRDDEDPAVT
jgi:hypothetical protein